MKTHHGSTTVRWLFIINLRLVFECCWKYFPPHDQDYYCSQYINACFIFWHSWACPSPHLSAWTRNSSLLSGCLRKRPLQFQICNQKLHFEFHFYFHLEFIVFERTPGLGQLSQNLMAFWNCIFTKVNIWGKKPRTPIFWRRQTNKGFDIENPAKDNLDPISSQHISGLLWSCQFEKHFWNFGNDFLSV